VSRTELDIHVMGPSGHQEFNFEIVKQWDRRTSKHVFVVYYLNSSHYNGSYLRQVPAEAFMSFTFGERARVEDASKFVDKESAEYCAHVFVQQKTGGEA
jgi:hypothetical protein